MTKIMIGTIDFSQIIPVRKGRSRVNLSKMPLALGKEKMEIKKVFTMEGGATRN